MSDYTMRYCELDVLLLASVFEAFRNTCLQEGGYGLDPAHFITAPSLSFQAMLLRNMQRGVRIENFSCDTVGMDAMLMTEKGIRGGVCQVMHPYVKANNIPLVELRNRIATAALSGEPVQGEPEMVIAYLDANNLYGEAMSEPLPIGDYEWLKNAADEEFIPDAMLTKLTEDNDQFIFTDDTMADLFEKAIWYDADMQALTDHIMSLDPSGPYGYMLEVDLGYPEGLHDLHNDFPFCPENKYPPDPSPYTKDSFARQNQNRFATKKLILDLTDKTEYVVHYRYLQLALQNGLVLKKVRRVLRFAQSLWLKDYVSFNTEKRKKAANNIEKEFYKLMVNSIFGKMMEQVKNFFPFSRRFAAILGILMHSDLSR